MNAIYFKKTSGKCLGIIHWISKFGILCCGSVYMMYVGGDSDMLAALLAVDPYVHTWFNAD